MDVVLVQRGVLFPESYQYLRDLRVGVNVLVP